MPLPLPFDGVRCSGAYFIHENVIIQLLYKDTGYKSGINALIFTSFQSLWPNKKSPTVCQLSWHCYSHRVPMLCQKHFSNQIENSTPEMLNSQWKTYQLLYVPSYFDDFVFVPPTLFVYHKHTLLQSILSVAAQTKMMMKKKEKQHQTQHTYNTCTSTYIRIIVQQSNKMSISQQRKRKANERKQDKTETHQTEWMTEKGTFIEWNKKWTKYCGKQINTAQQSSTITTVYVRDSWKCAWLTALYKLLCSVRFALFGSTLSLIFLHLMRWPLLFCCALFSLCSFAICSLLHTITVIIAYTGHAALARSPLFTSSLSLLVRGRLFSLLAFRAFDTARRKDI